MGTDPIITPESDSHRYESVVRISEAIAACHEPEELATTLARMKLASSCTSTTSTFCLPSKNIIHGAQVTSYFRRSKEFGITHDGFTVDMSGVREHKRKMVSDLNEVYLDNYRKTRAEFILGTGRFIAPRAVEVVLSDGTTHLLHGTNVIVSTGTRDFGSNPRSCSSATTHAYRGARTQPSSGTSACNRRWLCRSGAIPGDAPFRQQSDSDRSQ